MGTYNKQILKDTTKDTIVKFTGIIDAGTTIAQDPANTSVIVKFLSGALDANGNLLAANTARGVYKTSVKKIVYSVSCAAPGVVQVNYRGNTANQVIANLGPGADKIDFEPDNCVIAYDVAANGINTANCGDLFLSSNAVTAGAFTVIVHLRKDNNDFSAGQFADPVAFNQGPAGFPRT
jgi:hypothetical protein